MTKARNKKAVRFNWKEHFTKQSDGSYLTLDGKWSVHRSIYACGWNVEKANKERSYSALGRVDTLEQALSEIFYRSVRFEKKEK